MPPRHPSIARALGSCRRSLAVLRSPAFQAGGGADGLHVACSGGPDSVALLGLLCLLAPRDRLRLSVGHVDHGLRPSSGDDAALVRRLAEEHGLPFELDRLDLPPGPGLPARAREARRAALRDQARRRGAAFVVLGHTATDQAETILLHLARGAGLPGLAAMAELEPWDDPPATARLYDWDDAPAEPLAGLPWPIATAWSHTPAEPLADLPSPAAILEPDPLADPDPAPAGLEPWTRVPTEPLAAPDPAPIRPAGGWLRPLLALDRAQTRELAQRLRLPFVDDPTNLDRGHPRVRMRLELLPALRELNPRVEAALARTAAHARQAEDALQAWADRELRARRCPLPDPRPVTSAPRWSTEGMAELPAAVRTRIVRRVCRAAGAPDDALKARTLVSIDDALVHPGPARAWDLHPRLRVHVANGELWTEDAGPAGSAAPRAPNH